MRRILFMLFVIVTCLQILAGFYLLAGELNFVWIHFTGLAISMLYISIRHFGKKPEQSLLSNFLNYFFVVFNGLEIAWAVLLIVMMVFFGFQNTSLFYISIVLLLLLHSFFGIWLNRKINKEWRLVLNTEETIEAM